MKVIINLFGGDSGVPKKIHMKQSYSASMLLWSNEEPDGHQMILKWGKAVRVRALSITKKKAPALEGNPTKK